MAQKCRLILPLGEGKTSGELRRKRRRYFPFSGNISAHFYHIVPQRRERPLCNGPLPCNSPASRHEREVSPFPFAAYLLREIALQWLTFVHTAYKSRFGASLRPQCRSRGVFRPVPSKPVPDHMAVTVSDSTASSDRFNFRRHSRFFIKRSVNIHYYTGTRPLCQPSFPQLVIFWKEHCGTGVPSH